MNFTGVFVLLSLVICIQATEKYGEDVNRTRTQKRGKHVCKKPVPAKKFRSMGSEDAYAKKHPYMVGIYCYGAENMFCGGALISKEWVITAGHCVDGFEDWKLIFGAQWRTDKDKKRVERKVMDNYVHSKYVNSGHNRYRNDIALLKIDGSLPKTSLIKPIKLPEADQNIDGLELIVTGWGAQKEDGDTKENLAKVSVLVQTREQCIKKYEMTDSVFCAEGIDEWTKLCSGDDGNPAVYFENSKKFTLVGLVSRGQQVCDRNFLYVRISHYLDWIKSITHMEFRT